MRQLIVFTEDELRHMLVAGNEVEYQMGSGQTFVFMSEETYRNEMKLKSEKKED